MFEKSAEISVISALLMVRPAWAMTWRQELSAEGKGVRREAESEGIRKQRSLRSLYNVTMKHDTFSQNEV
jgi:hypothetical protein